MALDQVEVMEKLGFRPFAMVSHDRGARVAHRLALDHPDRLTRLVMMDICPTHYMYKTADRQFASAYFHWFFLIQAAPFPETLIGNNVDAFLKIFMGPVMPKFIEPDAYAEYRRCFSDPATIHASCEDYRAAATIDLAHDEADMDEKSRVRSWCSGVPMASSAENTMFWRYGGIERHGVGQGTAIRPLADGRSAG